MVEEIHYQAIHGGGCLRPRTRHFREARKISSTPPPSKQRSIAPLFPQFPRQPSKVLFYFNLGTPERMAQAPPSLRTELRRRSVEGIQQDLQRLFTPGVNGFLDCPFEVFREDPCG
jgi:hypothetical protein